MSPPFENTAAQGQSLAARNAPAGPAIAFLGEESPLRDPVPSGPIYGAETLRQLAARYLHDPNTQVLAAHMEHGPDHRVRVVIQLEITDL
jgi:hypothetical protein